MTDAADRPIISTPADALHVGIGLGVLGYQRLRIVQRQIDEVVDSILDDLERQLPGPADDLVRVSRSIIHRVRR